MSFYPQTHVKTASDDGDDGRSTTRRQRRPRWGVVQCPDGPHRVDLDAMRRAMTRMFVARELTDQPTEDIASKAGVSRSTVSRIFNGRGVGLRTLLAVLAVLRLPFEDAVSDTTIPTEGPTET